MSGASEHVARIRALYKALLKLHRGLPVQMQALGNQYMKEEFKRHKNAKKDASEVFVHEWTKYYVVLAKQLGARKQQQNIGLALSPEMLDNFNDEQLGQLKELFEATTKPASCADSSER